MQTKNVIVLLLITAFIMSTAGCKKEKITPMGNWQLTGFSQTICGLLYGTDTIQSVFSNSIVTYDTGWSNAKSYALMLQMNFADNDSVTIHQLYGSLGLPLDATVHKGAWDYSEDTRKMYFTGLGGSFLHGFGYHPNSIEYYTVETLTDNVLVLTYHYSFVDNNPNYVLEENTCRLTFSKY